MDKTLWRNIIANDYVLPEQQSLADLTSTLLSYLGLTDPELRESIAYPILEKWVDRAYYSCIDLWNMAERLLHNFTIGLGEEGTDTIFLRSFSILTLVDIIACAASISNSSRLALLA